MADTSKQTPKQKEQVVEEDDEFEEFENEGDLALAPNITFIQSTPVAHSTLQIVEWKEDEEDEEDVKQWEDDWDDEELDDDFSKQLR